jgi:nucleolar protein 14
VHLSQVPTPECLLGHYISPHLISSSVFFNHRTSIPFVFEVPTTLEALHDMIGNFASTGADASLIVQRIHASNSVRLNKNNREKMQNFYDVLLRRFIAVGDAIYTSGDGGPDLGRHEQLDSLTKTLYAMSQDSPECAGAVWSRRLGIFQKALGKRLRDSELIQDEDEDAAEFSVWPSCGTFLLLRALGHIFPVTDMRHPVVTPAILLIGQMIAQAPVKSISDLTMGVFLSGLMLEYTKDAKRVAPEALAFLAGVLRLFSLNVHDAALKNPVPSLEAAVSEHQITSLRLKVGEYCRESKDHSLKLSLEKEMICGSSMPASILYATLHLIEMTTQTLDGALNDSDAEVFVQITQSLLCIDPKNKESPLTGVIANKLGSVVKSISKTCRIGEPRPPLMLRKGATTLERSVKSLAPRIEDPTRYAMSKDKGKKSEQQSILDRNRREYKREHKAVSRELRLDAAFVENIRRTEKQEKDSAARNKRNKNHAWLEQEQATMNQQVRMGGGLLQGGGTGAARAKARSGKLGIKKGGKMS